ncbi:hypothetical protein B0H14DRAFT_3489322 [Mycena olivaceomarginata]|nr:hypothetical protein B0H14DRAFT_3489322 [Mycena olivaceomarginata]
MVGIFPAPDPPPSRHLPAPLLPDITPHPPAVVTPLIPDIAPRPAFLHFPAPLVTDITPHSPAIVGVFQLRCLPTSLLILPPSSAFSSSVDSRHHSSSRLPAFSSSLRCLPTSLLILPPSSPPLVPAITPPLRFPAPVLPDIIPRRFAFLGFCQPIARHLPARLHTPAPRNKVVIACLNYLSTSLFNLVAS